VQGKNKGGTFSRNADSMKERNGRSEKKKKKKKRREETIENE
jgi:hypothetical protein